MTHKKNTVLVTGATGFLGRKLVFALSKLGSEVTILTRDIAQARKIFPNESIVLQLGDITNPDSLEGILSGIDTVFHLASFSEREELKGVDNPHWAVTAEGTKNLLKFIVADSVRQIIFISTVKVAGTIHATAIDESCAPTPSGHYGKAKFAAEKLILHAAQQHHIQSCILRLPPLYGDSQISNITKMIALVKKGLFPPLPEVHNLRSSVHVMDAVRAILTAHANKNSDGETYIVTDDECYSTRQLYEWICRSLNKKPGRGFPLPVFKLLAKIGDVLGGILGRPFLFNTESLDKLIGSACYSSKKIQRELGFRPRHNLRNSLPRIVSWLEKQ